MCAAATGFITGERCLDTFSICRRLNPDRMSKRPHNYQGNPCVALAILQPHAPPGPTSCSGRCSGAREAHTRVRPGAADGDYTPEQREQALELVFGVDTQLIEDGTYFVAEARVEENQVIAGCGGWSKRKTLYGSDHCAGREDALLDPDHDAAKIRAFFVHPDWARRGVGSRILEVCEAAAAAGGFPAPGDGSHPYRSTPLPRPRLRRRGAPRGAASTRLIVTHRPHGKAALTASSPPLGLGKRPEKSARFSSN
jgi:GNAT superfamily N-acetyltransferase